MAGTNSPITNNVKEQSLRVGMHTGADIATAPGSLTWLQPRKTWNTSDMVTMLARDLQRDDNQDFNPVVGPQAAEVITGLALETYGLAAVASTGIAASVTGHELAHFLHFACGAAPDTTAGYTIASVDEAAPSITLDTGGGANFAANTFVQFGRNVRMIESISGDVLTLDRGGWTDTPTGIAYGSATYTVDPSVHDPAGHLYFETQNRGSEPWQRNIFGCAIAGLTFMGTEGTRVMTEVGNVQSNKWENDLSPSAAAFVEASNGTTIISASSPVYIGDTLYDARSVKAEIALTVTPKASTCGENGRAGFFISARVVKLMLSLYYGDTLKRTIGDTNTTGDVLIQFGEVAGRSMGIRVPAADIQVKRARTDGMEMLECECMATRDSRGLAFIGLM